MIPNGLDELRPLVHLRIPLDEISVDVLPGIVLTVQRTGSSSLT